MSKKCQKCQNNEKMSKMSINVKQVEIVKTFQKNLKMNAQQFEYTLFFSKNSFNKNYEAQNLKN